MCRKHPYTYPHRTREKNAHQDRQTNLFFNFECRKFGFLLHSIFHTFFHISSFLSHPLPLLVTPVYLLLSKLQTAILIYGASTICFVCQVRCDVDDAESAFNFNDNWKWKHRLTKVYQIHMSNMVGATTKRPGKTSVVIARICKRLQKLHVIGVMFIKKQRRCHPK